MIRGVFSLESTTKWIVQCHFHAKIDNVGKWDHLGGASTTVILPLSIEDEADEKEESDEEEKPIAMPLDRYTYSSTIYEWFILFPFYWQLALCADSK